VDRCATQMTLPQARKRIILGPEHNNPPTLPAVLEVQRQYHFYYSLTLCIYLRQQQPVLSPVIFSTYIIPLHSKASVSTRTRHHSHPPPISVDLNMSDAYAREE